MVFSSVPLRGVPAKISKKQPRSSLSTRHFLQVCFHYIITLTKKESPRANKNHFFGCESSHCLSPTAWQNWGFAQKHCPYCHTLSKKPVPKRNWPFAAKLLLQSNAQELVCLCLPFRDQVDSAIVRFLLHVPYACHLISQAHTSKPFCINPRVYQDLTDGLGP